MNAWKQPFGSPNAKQLTLKFHRNVIKENVEFLQGSHLTDDRQNYMRWRLWRNLPVSMTNDYCAFALFCVSHTHTEHEHLHSYEPKSKLCRCTSWRLSNTVDSFYSRASSDKWYQLTMSTDPNEFNAYRESEIHCRIYKQSVKCRTFEPNTKRILCTLFRFTYTVYPDTHSRHRLNAEIQKNQILPFVYVFPLFNIPKINWLTIKYSR